MAHDVFISYSSKNKQVADAICSALEQRKMRCWIAPRDVPPGGNYGEAIVHAIAGCQVVVLVYSAAVNLSAAVMREAERAMHHAKPIIPFRLEDVPMQPGLEFFLASCHWLDAIHPPMEEHIQRLGDAVESLMGREVANPVPFPAAAAHIPVRKARVAWLPILLGGTLVAGGAALVAMKPWQGAPPAAAPPAANTSPTEAAKSPSLAIALAGAGENVIAGHFHEAAPGSIHYISSEDSGKLVIRPALPKGVPLLAADAKGRHFAVEPLQIELKLIHNGPGTLYFHTATLEVESSQVVSTPLWFIEAKGLPKSVELTHTGDEAEAAKLRYTLAGPQDAGDLSAVTPLALPEEGRWHLDLAEGKTLLGEILPAPGGQAIAFEVAGSKAPTPPPSPAKPKEPAYDLTLGGVEGAYDTSTDLSQNLRSGEGDRFFLSLNAETWSRHRFKIALEYDDGSGAKKSIESGWVEAEIFRE
ncbi:toll/interleukin-1 receptor domain-containing protein [Haloferula sp. BvORR071]|uniref:toll/interleukin-1 receptor domain-containing protein n=1 Tax=Haloferula sp. BvORR071 TaxID=1396141 RepID=UPI000697EB67|nr:toll/interleukin-1 receptor domain-containing protein [Haloferula sp. BvORR071]